MHSAVDTTGRRWQPHPRLVLAVLIAVMVASTVAAQTSSDQPVTDVHEAVRLAADALTQADRASGRAYAPFRRGLPAERAEWAQLEDLHKAVGEVARRARTVQQRVKTLADEPGFAPAVPAWQYRERHARVDSLVAVALSLAVRPWNQDLPADTEEARPIVERRAREAKLLAAHTAAAGADVAYAAGVTEGIAPRTLNLSMVGILVVFSVLAMIALVVGAIRKLDDGWQVREEKQAATALEREPTIDATTLVLIGAACATVIAGRFRVRRVRRLLSPRAKRTPWSAQGRLILQGSHTVGRKQN